MKYKKRKKIVPVAMILCLTAGIFLGCKKRRSQRKGGRCSLAYLVSGGG